MQLTTTAGQLRNALALARHATPASPALVAYSGVLLEVKGSTLHVTGSDGETTITATVDVDDAKDGSVLLLPRPLGGYLDGLDPARRITVTSTSTGDATVSPTGGNPYQFRPVSASFPQPPTLDGTPVPFNAQRLGTALTIIRSAVARENLAVQLVSSNKGLVLHSTDTYRLSRAVLPEAGFGDFTALFPLPVLERASKLAVSHVALDTLSRLAVFSGPGFTITSRLLATPFPAVETVLDNQPDTSVTFQAADVLDALTRLAAVAEQSALKVRLDGNTMTLAAKNDDLGSGTETVTLDAPAREPFEFMVRLSYLADALGSGASQARLSYSGPLAPLFFSGNDPLTHTYIVMPVRG